MVSCGSGWVVASGCESENTTGNRGSPIPIGPFCRQIRGTQHLAQAPGSNSGWKSDPYTWPRGQPVHDRLAFR